MKELSKCWNGDEKCNCKQHAEGCDASPTQESSKWEALREEFNRFSPQYSKTINDLIADWWLAKISSLLESARQEKNWEDNCKYCSNKARLSLLEEIRQDLELIKQMPGVNFALTDYIALLSKKTK